MLTAVASRRWQSQSAVLNYTWTVSPSLLTSSSLSYNRASNIAHAPDFPGHHALGINVPIMSTGDTFRIGVNDYFSNSYNALYRVPRNQYNLQHGWTYIFGRHELSWGGDILREQSILDQDFNSDGTFTFGGRYSGNNLVDFLYGKPSAFTQITTLYNNLLRNLYGLYVEDNFKVTRRPTLNLGLRWNPFIPFTDHAGRQFSQFSEARIARVRFQRFPNLPPGQLAAGDPGVPGIRRECRMVDLRSAPWLCAGCIRQRQDQYSRRLRPFPRPDAGPYLLSPGYSRRRIRSASISRRPIVSAILTGTA